MTTITDPSDLAQTPNNPLPVPAASSALLVERTQWMSPRPQPVEISGSGSRFASASGLQQPLVEQSDREHIVIPIRKMHAFPLVNIARLRNNVARTARFPNSNNEADPCCCVCVGWCIGVGIVALLAGLAAGVGAASGAIGSAILNNAASSDFEFQSDVLQMTRAGACGAATLLIPMLGVLCIYLELRGTKKLSNLEFFLLAVAWMVAGTSAGAVMIEPQQKVKVAAAVAAIGSPVLVAGTTFVKSLFEKKSSDSSDFSGPQP